MRRFDSKIAVVTGAASGIGRAITEALLAEGATVFGADLNTEGLPDGAVPVALDVRDASAVEALMQRAAADHPIDIVFANAGIASTTDAVACSVDEWDNVFAVNTRGAFLCAKYALPSMLAAQRGALVFTASVAGLVGFRDRTAYCASKGAVVALTKQLAIQYAASGVRVNCVCPGTVESPWVAGLLREAGDPDAARAALVARQPLGRLGSPDEIASAALFLASDDAAFVTGECFVVDGGIAAG